jgi:hypothetical protein
MDRQLLKAYIRTIVEEEVQRVLPKLLGEAVAEVKAVNKLNESATPVTKKPTLDRSRLAELMGIDYDRDNGTIRASTNNLPPKMVNVMDSSGNKVEIPADRVDPEVLSAITRDYSHLMKAMKIV